MTPEPLRQTLQNLLHAEVSGNVAFDHLMLDYSNYHGIFLLLGTPIALIIGLAAFLSWRKVILLRGQELRRTERRMNALLGLFSTVTALFLGLVLVGNASNVLNPRHGFTSLVETLPPAQKGSALAQVRHAFDVWLSSGSALLPETVREHVQERLSWQQPKAILCGLILVVLTALTMKFWNQTVKTNTQPHAAATSSRTRIFLVLAIPVLHLLALMFIANTQAAFAPITITMLYG